MPSIHTLAVHAGERGLTSRPADGAQAAFGAVVTPIYHSVGYTYEDMEDLDAVFAGTSDNPVYTRYGNPTVAALEAAAAALEGGEAALAYGSGMAALHAALLAAGARAGSTVVAAHDIYGATYALLDRLLASQGVTVRFVDAADLGAVERALAGAAAGTGATASTGTTAGTRATAEARATARVAPTAAVLVETISNPLLKVADLPRLAALAHGAGAALIVDNTFATPVLCRPLALGADFVVHSATKYLGGHGDVLGGVVVASAARRASLNEINKLVGANLGPQEAWLIHRGLKTLPLRVERQCANARQIAGWLAGQPAVAQVNYPGLPTHPQHALAGRLLGGAFGAMISFDLRGAGRAEVFRFMKALRLVQPATTLGDVYTLALYPAMSSHRALAADVRRRIGIGDGLVRLSVGIEDAGDIIADLGRALAEM